MNPHVLAHAGGWDEILFFVVPAILAVFGLRWAERKARRRSEDEDQSEEDRAAEKDETAGR